MAKQTLATLRKAYETCLQALFVSIQDEQEANQANIPYKLTPLKFGSDPIKSPNRIEHLMEEHLFSASDINKLRANKTKLSWGNLIVVVSECLRIYLKHNNYDSNPLGAVSKNGKCLLTSKNSRSLYAIISCMRNAFCHNPVGGTWNITAHGTIYKQVWNFHQKVKSKNVDITLDLTNADGNDLDFDKDLGGSSQAFHLLDLCKQLFDNTITIANL